MLLTYAIYRRDPVFMLGQSMGLVVYAPQPLADPCLRPPGLKRRAFALGLVGIALVTLWRLALLPFDSADLFVDDAQYWFWGQTLDWGYYSKPPLIAWILRLSTSLGSDAPFFIRLPLPLIHAATAVVVALIARRLFGPRIGGIAGFAFATLPGVALGSLLVSTDTPMLFCFALAMLAQLHLAARRSLAWAAVLGAAVGTGLMAKYAMIYFPLSAALAALLLPAARIAWRDALLAALVALLIVSPNLAWNAANQFATLHHTADNADWRGPRLDLAGLAEFLAGQFAVAGPVFFAAYLAGLRHAASPERRYLALMSLPILAIVSVQALVSGANANWAAAAHLAALVLATAVLAPRPRLLAAGLAINLAVTAGAPRRRRLRRQLARRPEPRPPPLRRPVRPQPPRRRDRARERPRHPGQRQPRHAGRLLLHPPRLRPRDLRRAHRRLPAPPLRPEAPAAARRGRRPLHHPHRHRPRLPRRRPPSRKSPAGSPPKASSPARSSPSACRAHCWFPNA